LIPTFTTITTLHEMRIRERIDRFLIDSPRPCGLGHIVSVTPTEEVHASIKEIEKLV
jgi:hypothetical protein